MVHKRAVYCTGVMKHFGERVARVLDCPLFVDTFCGDVDTVHIIGMYDIPDYAMTLTNTSRCKRKIIHWCGGDVMFLRDATKLPYAEHIAESENLTAELLTKGIVAKTITFPTEVHLEPEPFAEQNSIAFYGGSNPDKYGASILAAVKDALPEWEILAYMLGSFDNIQMRNVIRDCKVYVRFTDHDGSMNSAREFMEAGRFAITTSPIPFAKTVCKNDIPGIVREIKKLEKVTEPDMLAHQYYKRFNSEERFLDEMKAGGFFE